MSAIVRNITDRITYGSSIKKNALKDIPDIVYITILCGAPVGSIIHPTFAAIVCRDTVGIIRLSWLIFFNERIVNGTNMINEMSLVINIELINR